MSYRISEDIDMLDFRLMSDEDIVELANSNNSQALDYLLYKYKIWYA